MARRTTSCRTRCDITDLGREHPITAGIDDFDLVTEQYWVLHDDLIDVLATTTHPTQAVAPVAPAGHLAGDLDPAVGCRAHRRDDPGAQPGRAGAPGVRTVIERGMVWATRTASAS